VAKSSGDSETVARLFFGPLAALKVVSSGHLSW